MISLIALDRNTAREVPNQRVARANAVHVQFAAVAESAQTGSRALGEARDRLRGGDAHEEGGDDGGGEHLVWLRCWISSVVWLYASQVASSQIAVLFERLGWRARGKRC